MGPPALLMSKDRSCIFTSTPTRMFYIFLIKVPPWAGRASERWLSAEVQGGSGVKHGIRRRAPVLRDALAPTPEASPLGLQEGRPAGRWRVGGGQAHPWVARVGFGTGGEFRQESAMDDFHKPAGGWAAGESCSCRHQPCGHSLSVSNYDKWRRADVAGWQLPHRGGKQVFLARGLGALALSSLITANSTEPGSWGWSPPPPQPCPHSPDWNTSCRGESYAQRQ